MSEAYNVPSATCQPWTLLAGSFEQTIAVSSVYSIRQSVVTA
ncbi:MAG TPA: hypothetical protein VGD71_09685 [Kribbella sp.]|jgi:hypothetical protein